MNAALGEGEQVWTHDRKVLEMAIQAEKAADQSDWNPDLQSEEQRLTRRLNNLALEMKVMVGDGNCQVRLPFSEPIVRSIEKCLTLHKICFQCCGEQALLQHNPIVMLSHSALSLACQPMPT